MNFKFGDKVRVNTEFYAGAAGVVVSYTRHYNTYQVTLTNNITIEIDADKLTPVKRKGRKK